MGACPDCSEDFFEFGAIFYISSTLEHLIDLETSALLGIPRS